METVVKRTYEGMFLIDSAEAAADWKGMTDAVERVLTRSEAEVISLKKWDERRLAYDINKKGRGTYILTYFKCDPTKIGSIERDVQLSEKIMRVMVLRTDRMSDEDMAKPTPAMTVEAAAAAAQARAAAAAAAKEAAEEEEAAAAKEVAAAAEAEAPEKAEAPPEAEAVEAAPETEAVVEETAEAAGEPEAPQEEVPHAPVEPEVDQQ